MKKLAAIALTAVLLTGCSTQPSEEWLAAKHECVVAGWEVNEDRAAPQTFTEVEAHCNRMADKRTNK